ncbi:MAG: hypothetical protein B6D72_06965 [gamma proteobacterium symbiont of Ctena orbiculata]|uniref:Uncharacterized protein n=1 Tax=Candidatus Thiodiazotropha taylori TaxID=2792791 RepID=A0A944QTV5_9GAMM|nr:hypothetical protein [Candidatus Thiodiazotropha taylori]PUB88521.1 MAG: hypothetical protein DBP00_05760 [gamma proteobacterium symbiont of Ctena orbiculata]MBT2990348.1 hypothetical protein [Candidatus Thiodiazotropha taylori]MBT2998003.1 hypothetical protein [Candidatus Thiodiazotropha taylori]MBT3002214.1 hypothetical protein [Candidatus Thiodiazotropha taylori]
MRFYKIEGLANRIVERLHQEVLKLGFASGDISLKRPQEASYRLERDPASCEYSLVGDWLSEQGMKLGTLLFHADGSFFVEQDVVRPHPRHSGWFVEAVNAWGRGDVIKAEARLLAMPE